VKIYKYKIEDQETAMMPRDAKLLHVGFQHSHVTVWALVDPEAPLVERQMAVFGTGWEISEKDAERYVGTVQVPYGLVWHVFDLGEI
jgi:hypothetical protein